MSDSIHVTKINSGDVFGHSTIHCDPSGCNGIEHYYRFVAPEDVELDHVYEMSDDGTIAYEIVDD